MQQQSDYVLRTVEERGVRFVHLWFTDVLGSLKSFAITPAELETSLEEGMTFAIETQHGTPGMHGVRIEEMVAVTKTGAEVLSRWPVEEITEMT